MDGRRGFAICFDHSFESGFAGKDRRLVVQAAAREYRQTIARRWIGVLFALGSTCFLIAPFPGFLQLVGSGADGIVFFVGSIFFTAAASLQYIEATMPTAGPRMPKRGGAACGC